MLSSTPEKSTTDLQFGILTLGEDNKKKDNMLQVLEEELNNEDEDKFNEW